VSVRRLNEGASSKGSCRNRNGWKRFVYGVAPSCAPIESRSASAALNGRTITVKSSMSPSVLVWIMSIPSTSRSPTRVRKLMPLLVAGGGV
jgi:hypothetical protein